MNDSLKELLAKLVPLLGQEAVDQLEAEITAAARDVPQDWQKIVFTLLADAVKSYGPHVVVLATEAVTDALGGKPGIVFDWTDLRTASELLAKLQSAEADKAEATEKFLVVLERFVQVVLSAMFKALV